MGRAVEDKREPMLESGEMRAQSGFEQTADECVNLFYVLSGGGGIYIDGDWFELEDDMIFLTMPDNIYRFDSDSARIFNVRFSLGAADAQWLAPLACDPDSSVFYISGDDVGVFRTFLSEMSEGGEYARLMLNCVLAKLAASCEPFEKNTASKRAGLYMRCKFSAALTLEECAQYAGLVPTYFSEVYKRETGMNFKKSLSTLRLEFAKKLLINTDMPIADICERCGFGDYANFIRAFGKLFGDGPATFRKNANK